MILLFFLSIFQQPDYQRCQQYYQAYEDDSLRMHLDLISDHDDSEVQLIHQLYEAKLLKLDRDFSASIERLYNCLTLFESGMDSLYIAEIYDELALNLKNLGVLDREKSLSFINQSIAIKGRHSSTTLDRSLSIKGQVLYSIVEEEEDPNIRSQYLKNAINYWKQAISVSHSESVKEASSSNMISAMIELEEYGDALELINAMDTIESLSNQAKVSLRLKRAGIYCMSSDFNSCLTTLDSVKSNYFDSMTLHERTALYASYINVYDSLKVYPQVIAYMDSLKNLDHLLFDEKNFEAEEKYRNALLQNNLLIEKSKVLNNRLIALVLSGVVALLLIGIALINRMRKVKAIESKAKLEQAQLNAQIKAVSARAAGEQSERLAIANKLHDEISSMLTAASFMVQGSKKTLNVETISKAGELIKDVSGQIRNISHELVSPTLVKLGFAKAILSYVESIQGGKFMINVNQDLPSDRYEFTKEQFLYQSTIELIQNAMKYSDKELIELSVKKKDSYLEINVKNSISHDHQFNDDGLGTLNLISRATAFGGKFSRIKKDSTVLSSLRIPI